MIEEFHYRVPWRSKSAHPGMHSGSHLGGEHEFYGHAPLISRPEAHNIDIHASLLDPFQQFVVRTFRQRGIINVCVLADLSASMNFQNKMALLADFTEKTAYSVFRSGDHFSFIGGDENLRSDFFLPPRWYKGGVVDLVEQLRQFEAQGKHCRSLVDIAEVLPRHRALIFLVSDFHFPLAEITRIFDGLNRHDVVPVVLWHDKEYADLPEWGLLNLYDPETAQHKLLCMRPRLKAKIKANFLARRRQLIQLFLRYGRQPFFVSDFIQADQMTRYFYEQ
jgi:uncharacterized protein (DUF58 family)